MVYYTLDLELAELKLLSVILNKKMKFIPKNKKFNKVFKFVLIKLR